MARVQKIKPDGILNAAARVIARLGSVGLFIVAVAREMGISKSQVIYYHESKSGILEVIIATCFDSEVAKGKSYVKKIGAEFNV